MLIDLHTHYPMHLHGGPHAGIPLRSWLPELAGADLVDRISRYRNYEGPGDTPAVSMDLIRAGRVDVVLSALYWPFDEVEPRILLGELGNPPSPRGPGRLLDQLELVEDDIASRSDVALVVRRRADLDLALASGLTAMVHCVEGGVLLGEDADQVNETVAKLANRGVAYVTLAHLFWRRVATNAPALPMLTDAEYHRHFPQGADEGLSDLGRAAVDALVRHRVVIDVTHMSEQSLDETLGRVSSTEGEVPLIASHGAYRFDGYPEYNLSDASIEGIAALNGVVGLICCTHYVAFGRDPQPAWLGDSIALLCEHIDKIAELTHGYDHIAIGSDLDGYIKPALPGLKTIDKLQQLERCLTRKYGRPVAEKILGANALRMLHYRFPAP
jgi:microsomal dipeptidase-like Zn-dependent dipeptidase